jgi:Zn-dependent peptidase ImmA (M78 family)
VQRLTKKDMVKLIEHWRSLIDKRPLTYGEHLLSAREQAYHVRALADENQPALDLTWLVKQIAIPVSFVPSYILGTNSGLTTTRVGGKLQIFLNNNEPYLRQRFSLLHEWKHALDFYDQTVLFQDLGSGDKDVRHTQIEAIANDFAANVLMPMDLVIRIWLETRNIIQAAKMFNVSPEAMQKRLQKLGLIDKPGQQPPDRFRSATPAQATDPCVTPCAA